jgi:hypothetical protein
VRLKARIQRLQADVAWLKTWGALRSAELRLEILAAQKAMEQAAEARRPRAPRPVAPPPPPPRVSIPANIPVRPPTPPPTPPPRELPQPQPMGGQPLELPEPFQPVRWRIRGPQDWHDDSEDMVGRCYVDYDPLADA